MVPLDDVRLLVLNILFGPGNILDCGLVLPLVLSPFTLESDCVAEPFGEEARLALRGAWWTLFGSSAGPGSSRNEATELREGRLPGRTMLP